MAPAPHAGNKHPYGVVYDAVGAQLVVALPIAPNPTENTIVPEQQDAGGQDPPDCFDQAGVVSKDLLEVVELRSQVTQHQEVSTSP